MGLRTKLLLTVAVAVGLLTGGLFAGVLTEASADRAAAPLEGVAVSAESVLSGAPGRSTAAKATQLERAVRGSARPELLVQLGFVYQLRWRETGDASFLPRSQVALERALALRPDDPAGTIGLGNLALIRHDFRHALQLGREARRLAPDSVGPYAVLGDALLELGRYREAFHAFERMVARKPTLAGYARIAYARELIGDRPGALAALRLALDSAGGVPEPTAWTLVEIAKLQLGQGQIVAAERSVTQALRVFPGYVYAREQRARILYAQGRVGAAIREARRTADSIPLPQFVALAAELLEATGRPKAAAERRATIGVIQRLLVASGVRVDLELAVLDADRGARPMRTVAEARAARAARPSIVGDDALGWALARAGRCAEAESWLDRSLRLGTEDALLFFHRGYAAGCAGDQTAMRSWYRKALALNPTFSIRWAPVARRALAG